MLIEKSFLKVAIIEVSCFGSKGVGWARKKFRLQLGF